MNLNVNNLSLFEIIFFEISFSKNIVRNSKNANCFVDIVILHDMNLTCFVNFFRLRCTLSHISSFFRRINLWSTMFLRELSLITLHEIWEKFSCLIISTLLWCHLSFRFKKFQRMICLIFCLLNFWLTKVSCLLFESHDFFFLYSFFVSFFSWLASILL